MTADDEERTPADAIREVGMDPREAVDLPAGNRFPDAVDDASDDSFPASDPPSYSGPSAGIPSDRAEGG